MTYCTPYVFEMLCGINDREDALDNLELTPSTDKITQCHFCLWSVQFGLPCVHLLNISKEKNFIFKFIHSRLTRETFSNCYDIDLSVPLIQPNNKNQNKTGLKNCSNKLGPNFIDLETKIKTKKKT